MTRELVPGLDIPAERGYVADRWCRECAATIDLMDTAEAHWFAHKAARDRAYYAERERAWRRALEERW